MKKYTLEREINKILHRARTPVSMTLLYRRKELKALTKHNANIFNACYELINLEVATINIYRAGVMTGNTNKKARGRGALSKNQRRYLCYL